MVNAGLLVILGVVLCVIGTVLATVAPKQEGGSLSQSPTGLILLIIGAVLIFRFGGPELRAN